MVSRSGTRRTERSRQHEAVEKQETRWRASEHTYRDKEREEDRGPVVYATLLTGRGRGS